MLHISAQEKTPFPTLSDRHVYVSGVPDRYSAIEAQINQLERSSPQTYYVVIVKQVGPGPEAAIKYAEDLFSLWRSQAAKSRRSFDADRTILIVLAVDNKKIAVHPGAMLQNQFGLTRAKIERDLIRDVFIPYAEKDQYEEGLSALLSGILNQTNDTIAARDDATARAPVKITASGSTKARATPGEPQGTRRVPAAQGTSPATAASVKAPKRESRRATRPVSQRPGRRPPCLPDRHPTGHRAWQSSSPSSRRCYS